MEKRIGIEQIKSFNEFLIQSEKSKATIEKYIRDLKHFSVFANNRLIDKMLVIEYKNYLSENYAIRSANSMLAAVNVFFRYMKWFDMCVK